MADFAHRSYKKELLDGTDIPFKHIEQNMKELEFINSKLGGHSITINGFKQLARVRKKISICEIGCGGGDNLNAIARYCDKKKIETTFTGIDINPDCIAFAAKKCRAEVKLIVSDYKLVTFGDVKPDIIFSSLFCHHFTDDELVQMLQWMKANSNIGFFINDLHRHPVAFIFIKYATILFSRSYLVKNDAPLSVLRGFKKAEWKNILGKAKISNYLIEWKWAFRFLVTVCNPQQKT